MRFLHTSDWHVGKTLRGRSRLGEHEQVLAEILEISIQEQVECLLVCGDLFDSYAPSAEAERIVFRFLSELCGRGIRAVLISGNHDHPRRLNALAPLVEPLGIFIRTASDISSGKGLVEVSNERQTARIAVFPFLSHASLIAAPQLFEGSGEDIESYEAGVAALLASCCRPRNAGPVDLLLAHLHVASARVSGSERALQMASPYEVSARHLPAGLGYIALGHLHRPQEIEAPSLTAYSGSPLQLDFGEQGQRKQVYLVDVVPGKITTCRGIALTAGRPLLELEGTLSELESLREAAGNAYLKITIESPEADEGLLQRVREIYPDAVEIRVGGLPEPEEVTPRRIGRLSPEEMYREFYKSKKRARPSPALHKLFRQLYEEAVRETDSA